MRSSKRKFILLFFLLISVAATSFAQQPVYKSFDIRSENTRPRITKLFLDRHGMIWCGTDRGIFTFDGINFTKYFQLDSVNYAVTALYEDSISCIWAGFENGKILRIQNSNASFFTPQEGIPKVGITGFAEDGRGRLFISTKGEGIYYLENGRLNNINHDDGLSDDYCYGILMIPGNRICAGTDAGLNFVDLNSGKKRVITIGTSEGLPDDIVRAMSLDSSNILTIGMQDKGIARYDCQKNKIEPVMLRTKWQYGQVNNVVTLAGEIWAGTEENGVILITQDGNTKKIELNLNREIKSSDMLFDLENNLWISETIHLYRTSGKKISFFTQTENKKLEYIHCILADKSGSLWFSPDQQLGHLIKTKNGEWKYEEFKIVGKKVDIVSLYFDPYGFLWIGTLGEGVFRFNPATGKTRKITESTEPESTSILSINGTGNHIWVAGFNSVVRYEIRSNGTSDNATIEREPTFDANQIINDYVYTVFIDSKGKTWFGTDGSGVYRYDKNELMNYPVPENAVHSFAEDKQGRIWFATADAGLEYIDTNGNRKKFQTLDGLSDPSPTSLLCTNEGRIVIVHTNGFDVLNPDNGKIVYHSSEENLADLNGDLNSITIAPDSSIWMGTERGILNYIPSLDTKMNQPGIVLHSVSIFLNPIDFKNITVFDSDQNNIRFDYDGLWYSDPQRINYSFLLDGFTAKWESTKDHTVTFPKLPPGKYTFRIKASLNSNFDSADETSYTFEIEPPLWQRWWFRMGTAALAALFIFMIIRRRESRLRKFDRLQKEKIEFQFETLKSQVNPHFLFNSFNTLISVIENTPKQAVEYVEKLSEFFRNIVNYRDKNLITVSEEISLLNNYIFIQKKRYGENLKLEIYLDEKTLHAKYLPPLTLQLLSENAIKHNSVSKETPLTISIWSQDDKLIVKNNVNKKLVRETSAGFGLQNIKSMYALLTDEKVEIASKPESFIVTIPLLISANEFTNP